MSLIDLDNIIKSEYRTLNDDITRDFYIPLYKNSTEYCRAVGFFSSSVLAETVAGIGAFIKNNGKIKLVASPNLSDEDIKAIKDGYKMREEVIKNAVRREMAEPKNHFEESNLDLLANLIKDGYLDIEIAYTNNNNIGIYHEKLGIFSDGDNFVAFTGSMNETATALRANYEAIDVFCSWRLHDAERVEAKKKAFIKIWNKEERSIIIVDFPELKDEIILKYRRHSTDYSIEWNNKFFVNEGVESYNVGPRIPKDIKLHDYQERAISSWEANNYCGIFDMATGTGKTYTALAAIVHLYQHNDRKLGIIIVCPYQHLVEQWKNDIEKFGMKPIVCYSTSRQKHWKERLKTVVRGFALGLEKHFCIITTNATFSSDFVQDLMKKLSEDVLLVVDEAHNFGAVKLSRMLLQQVPYRLALSATIDRQGDEEGTKKIYEYFGKKCIEYTLKEAIENGMLVPYYYYPVLVSLNDNELERYLELTKKIRNFMHLDKGGNLVLSDQAKMLLIKRARIVAGASEKIKRLEEQLKKHTSDDHLLVYCGAATIRDEDYCEGSVSTEEKKAIDIVVDLLGNKMGMKVSKFTSEESAEEREIIKRDFAEGKHLQTLVAIRCLDEGVNIPSIKAAFILASSTNPKEYIQRRGRVLRKYSGKKFANIYDFITLPIAIETLDHHSDEEIQEVKSLAKREMARMKDFASISENPSMVDSLIDDIVEAYGITLDEEGGCLDV